MMIENKIKNFANFRALFDVTQSSEGSFILEVPPKHSLDDALDADYLSTIPDKKLRAFDRITVRGR